VASRAVGSPRSASRAVGSPRSASRAVAHLQPGSPGTRPSAPAGPGEKEPSCSRCRQQERHAGDDDGQYFPLPTAYGIVWSNAAAVAHSRMMEPGDGVSALFSSWRTSQGDDRRRREERDRGGNTARSRNSPAALTAAFSRAHSAAPASLADYSSRGFQGSAAPSSSPIDVSPGQAARAKALPTSSPRLPELHEAAKAAVLFLLGSHLTGC